MAKYDGCGLDVDLASEVQQLLFPKGSPVCDWCCLGVRNRMARGLGGDYYDFITMPDDCQVVFVGDVTGHGLHASVVMSLLYGFIHESAARGCSPLDTVSRVNAFLLSFARRSKKVDQYFSTTLFYSIIEPGTLMMNYINAGHVSPMVLRGQDIHHLEPSAQPLGFFNDPEMSARSFRLEKGDRLLLYTDGLTEAFDGRGRIFGRERLEEVLLAGRKDHLEFLNQIFQALEDFGVCDPPEDDCTAIVMDLNGPYSGS